MKMRKKGIFIVALLVMIFLSSCDKEWTVREQYIHKSAMIDTDLEIYDMIQQIRTECDKVIDDNCYLGEIYWSFYDWQDDQQACGELVFTFCKSITNGRCILYDIDIDLSLNKITGIHKYGNSQLGSYQEVEDRLLNRTIKDYKKSIMSDNEYNNKMHEIVDGKTRVEIMDDWVCVTIFPDERLRTCPNAALFSKRISIE